MNMLFPLLAVLIWSINAVVSKLSATAIDPAAISFYRWLLALITLTPFVLPGVIRHWSAIRTNWWKLLVLGMLGMVLYQSLAYYAAQSVSALFMGIIVSLIPLLTILISIVLLRVAPTVGIAIGSLLSLGGLIWLVSAGNPGELLQHGIGKGELMMFAATASYALYGVLTELAVVVCADPVRRGVVTAELPDGTRRVSDQPKHPAGAVCRHSGLDCRTLSVDPRRYASGGQYRVDFYEPGAGIYRHHCGAVPA